MKCDKCNSHLYDESDIHEYIVCGYCDRHKEIKHCNKCKCKLFTNELWKKIKPKLPSTTISKVILWLGIFGFINCLITAFNPVVAAALIIGVFCIPFAALSLLACFLFIWFIGWCLTVGVYRIGYHYGQKIFGNDFHDFDQSPIGYIFGLLIVSSPIILYGFYCLGNSIIETLSKCFS